MLIAVCVLQTLDKEEASEEIDAANRKARKEVGRAPYCLPLNPMLTQLSALRLQEEAMDSKDPLGIQDNVMKGSSSQSSAIRAQLGPFMCFSWCWRQAASQEGKLLPVLLLSALSLSACCHRRTSGA